MAWNPRRTRAVVTAGLVLAIGTGGLASTAAAQPAKKDSSISYSFTFVNGKTITGTASSNDTFIAGAGGTSAENPSGMTVHVSCSDPFTGGWGVKQGPRRTVDTAWQIASYTIDKGSKSCSGTFVTPPSGEPSIDIEMFVNGEDADEPAGPRITVPGTARFTYVVTNNGKLPLRDVVATDPRVGRLTCPKTSLAIGESMNCTPTSAAVTTPGAVTGSASVVGVADVPAAAAPPAPVGSKDISYSFTFVNGKTITGTASSNDTFIAGAGGTSAENPSGMTVHVSCSDPFTGGWGVKQGPRRTVDTAWQIASYTINKGKKTCGGTFAPVTRTVRDSDPVNYLGVPSTPPSQPSSIGDRVWLDQDGNGRQAMAGPGVFSEPGVQGVTVKLLDGNGAPATDLAGRAVASQITNADGFYRFTNLRSGRYQVRFEFDCRYSPTAQLVGGDGLNSDGVSTGRDGDRCFGITRVVDLPAGTYDPNVDYGLLTLS